MTCENAKISINGKRAYYQAPVDNEFLTHQSRIPHA